MTHSIGRRGLPADDDPRGEAPQPSAARRAVAPEPDEESPTAAVAPPSGPARRGIEPAAPRRPGWLLPTLGVGVVVLAIGALIVTQFFRSAPPTATGSPTPPASSAAASPTPSVTASPVALDDATISVPEGWELYADEQVQDDRRLVRIQESEADVRLQAVTLTSVTGELDTACEQLITEHEASYSNVATTPPFTVPVAPGGDGYSCGFRGVRASDSQPMTVTFTLLRRSTDDHTLVLRSTVPEGVTADSEAATQLEDITCQAATSFDVDLSRCR